MLDLMKEEHEATLTSGPSKERFPRITPCHQPRNILDSEERNKACLDPKPDGRGRRVEIWDGLCYRYDRRE